MDENETELGEEDFDDEEDSDEMPEEGNKYLYSKKNPLDYKNKTFTTLSDVRVS